jgi:hypothetical protein
MHAVRSAPSTSKPVDQSQEPETGSSPYDDYNPYGKYCTYSKQVPFKPILAGLEIPEELLDANRCLLERTKRDAERKRRDFAANPNQSRREGEGDDGGGCFCSPRASGDLQREREGKCSCTWVSGGILPLLCIDPSNAFDAISTFGVTTSSSSSSHTGSADADTHADAHSAPSPDLRKLRDMNASNVHSTHPPSEQAVLSQALGNLVYSILPDLNLYASSSLPRLVLPYVTLR